MKTLYLYDSDKGWVLFEYDVLSDLAHEFSIRNIRIGYGCKLGDDCKLGDGCELGDGCWLGNSCELGYGCKLGLLLFGTVGNGKSTLARAIGSLIGILYESAYFDQRKTVRTVSALELADIAKNEPERFNGIKKAELLAIDDVGTEPSVVKVWGNEISPFVDTIYYRYDRQLFTIMTSNLNAEDLANKYGERIADRFTEMFDRIPFINHSYRK